VWTEREFKGRDNGLDGKLEQKRIRGVFTRDASLTLIELQWDQAAGNQKEIRERGTAEEAEVSGRG